MIKIVKILPRIIIFITVLFIFCTPTSLADSLGVKEVFQIDSNYDYRNRNQVTSTLRHISQWGYFYIENDWWNSLDPYKRTQAEHNIKNLASEFDASIYPKLTAFFGNVWNPGIDNDSRITILITKLIASAGGYFDSCHVHSISKCSHSNERDMIIISADFMFDSKLKSFVAHELQHLINWNQKERLSDVEENVWLNEMRSEYAPTLLSYNSLYSGSILEMRLKSFLTNPSNPLGEWKGEAGDYGVITLFGHYLADHFGDNIFSLMSKNSLVGIISINQALKQAGYSEDFNDVFINWTLANYYNSLAMGTGGKYGYINPNLKKFHISPTVNSFYNYGFVSFSERVKDWSPRWYLLNNKLSSDDNSVALKLEFTASEKSNFRAPYMINYKDGSYELGFINPGGIAYIFNFSNNVKSVLVVSINQSKIINFTNNDSSTLFTLKASTIVVNQPVISSISPSSGSLSGGNQVSIHGGNFQEGVEVYFGGIKANVTFINETSLKVIVPAHESGLVNVWLKNPDEKSSVFAQGYEYDRGAITNGSLIRAKGDYKVYIVQNGYKRHILDGRIFDFYGHLNWSNIIEVTPEERDSYQTSNWIRAVNDKKVYEVNADKTKHWLNMTAEEFYVSGRRWEGVFIINNWERNFYTTGVDVKYK